MMFLKIYRTGTSCCWPLRKWRSSTAAGWRSTSPKAFRNGSAIHPTTINTNCVYSSTVPDAVPTFNRCSLSSLSQRIHRHPTMRTTIRRKRRKRRSERRGRRGGDDWSRMKNKIRIIKNNNNKLFNTGRSLLSTRIPAVRDVFDVGLRWIVVQQHRPVASRDSSWVSGRSDGTIGSSHLADIMPIIAEVIAEAAAAVERQSRFSVTIRTSSIRCANNCRWRWTTSTKRIRAKRRNC